MPTTVVVGDRVELRVGVRNVGAGPAWPLRVDVPLPGNMNPVSPSGTEGWDCDFGRDVETNVQYWGCTYRDPLAPGTNALPLSLFGTLVSGTPGDDLTFSVTAHPVEGEPSTADNTAYATVPIVAPAVVRGIVWGDSNGDGQRGPQEYGTNYQLSLWLVPLNPAEGDPVEVPVTVASDGTYRAAVKPGQWRVQARLENWVWNRFSPGDVGDDATDSDIVVVDAQPYQVVGDSAVLDLTTPAETVSTSARSTTDAGEWWWARQVSNLRPLACKASALPLSYAPGTPVRRAGAASLPCRATGRGRTA